VFSCCVKHLLMSGAAAADIAVRFAAVSCRDGGDTLCCPIFGASAAELPARAAMLHMLHSVCGESAVVMVGSDFVDSGKVLAMCTVGIHFLLARLSCRLLQCHQQLALPEICCSTVMLRCASGKMAVGKLKR
jgi:hypothetical protein